MRGEKNTKERKYKKSNSTGQWRNKNRRSRRMSEVLTANLTIPVHYASKPYPKKESRQHW